MIPCFFYLPEGPWLPQRVSLIINGSSFNILWSTARGGSETWLVRKEKTCWPLHRWSRNPPGPTSHFPIHTQWQTCPCVTFVESSPWKSCKPEGRELTDKTWRLFQPIVVGEDNFLVWVIKNQFLVDEVPYFLNKPIDGITILSPLFSDMSTFGWVGSCLLVGWPYFL